MSIRVEYFDYLSHFGETVTLSEFSKSRKNAIALRHDIDHSIDVALELAYWEAKRNVKATYFILNTAQYSNDPYLLDKCYQIQEFGHEVGIHLNSITRWFKSGDDPYVDLKKQLKRFREAGIKVCGTSAHGDRSCYENHFINYWLFKDLKGEDFITRESTLNAEGIYEPDDQQRVGVPCNDQLTRRDGSMLELWGITQQELGLRYEASHLSCDDYYTDSGGSWKRSPNPLNKKLKNKRVQVLMHPIHWRAPRKLYFFLSTARSGSKWLATVLDQASSCSARHEYTLNHFDDSGQVVFDKMTGSRLHELLDDGHKIEAGLQLTRNLVDHQENDYAEVNVYLPLVVSSLKEKFPDAKIIHLYRNLANVVSSIMNRGWYDTPYDTSHPEYQEKGWEACSPFEKCCIYVKSMTGLLMDETSSRIKLENAVSNSGYLEKKLNDLGIAFYPYLAREILGKKINENRLDSFPVYDHWDYPQKEIFKHYLSALMVQLGYELSLSNLIGRPRVWWQRFINRLRVRNQSEEIFSAAEGKTVAERSYANNIEIGTSSKGLVYRAVKSEEHSYILLNGGVWSKLEEGSGWFLRSNGYYLLSVYARVPGEVKAHAFCLYYDEKRCQVYKRSLGGLGLGERENRFSFAAMANARFFNIAVYLPVQTVQRCISISNVNLKFQNY